MVMPAAQSIEPRQSTVGRTRTRQSTSATHVSVTKSPATTADQTM